MGFFWKRLLANSEGMSKEKQKSKEVVKDFPQTLVLGGLGFVGTRILEDTKDFGSRIDVPDPSEVNLLNKESIRRYVKEKGTKVVVNLAAFTDVKESENQRKNEDGDAWQINVIGARNVAGVCKEEGVFLVHVSTDNVFHGSSGLSKEEDPITNDGSHDWYSYTKAMAEKEIEEVGGKVAIVRIGYPFGSLNLQKDYILKLLQTIKKGIPIFGDQRFTPTDLGIFSKALWKIVSMRRPGKYHVVCRGVTTPYKVACLVVKELGLPYKVKKGSLAEYEEGYEKKMGTKSPYNRTGGLDTTETESLLGMRFAMWNEAVKDFIYKLPEGLVSAPVV